MKKYISISLLSLVTIAILTLSGCASSNSNTVIAEQREALALSLNGSEGALKLLEI